MKYLPISCFLVLACARFLSLTPGAQARNVCQDNPLSEPNPTTCFMTILPTGSTIANPVFVNLYWDSNWDNDAPSGSGLTRFEIDQFTQALIRSGYFGSVSQ